MVFTILFSYLSIISLPIPTYLDILHFLSENLILNPSSLCSDDSITKRLSVFFFFNYYSWDYSRHFFSCETNYYFCSFGGLSVQIRFLMAWQTLRGVGISFLTTLAEQYGYPEVERKWTGEKGWWYLSKSSFPWSLHAVFHQRLKPAGFLKLVTVLQMFKAINIWFE